jgi:hypothetical protein
LLLCVSDLHKAIALYDLPLLKKLLDNPNIDFNAPLDELSKASPSLFFVFVFRWSSDHSFFSEQPPALVYCCYNGVHWLAGVKAILARKIEKKININAVDNDVCFLPSWKVLRCCWFYILFLSRVGLLSFRLRTTAMLILSLY